MRPRPAPRSEAHARTVRTESSTRALHISWRLACRCSPDFCRARASHSFQRSPALRRNSSTCATTRHQLPVRAVPLPSRALLAAHRRASRTHHTAASFPLSLTIATSLLCARASPRDETPPASGSRGPASLARAFLAAHRSRAAHPPQLPLFRRRSPLRLPFPLLSSARLATQSSTVKPATRISSAPTPTILPAGDAVSPRASAPAPATSARAHAVAAHSGALDSRV